MFIGQDNLKDQNYPFHLEIILNQNNNFMDYDYSFDSRLFLEQNYSIVKNHPQLKG